VRSDGFTWLLQPRKSARHKQGEDHMDVYEENNERLEQLEPEADEATTSVLLSNTEVGHRQRYTVNYPWLKPEAWKSLID
jgi:hypothetical protein